METSFTKQWKIRLWEYERTSLFALNDIPEQLSPDVITSYIKDHKLKQQLGSNPLTWLVVIWLPLLLFTSLNVALFYWLLQQMWLFIVTSHLLQIQLLSLLCVAYIFVAFTKINDLEILSALNLPLYWFGFGVACFCLLPFLPLFKVRQIQLQYSLQYRSSFITVFWRKVPPKLRQNKPLEYLTPIDQAILKRHRNWIVQNIGRDIPSYPNYYKHPIAIDGKLPNHYQTLGQYILPTLEIVARFTPQILAILGIAIVLYSRT